MPIDAVSLSTAIDQAMPSDFNYDLLGRDGKPQIQRQWLDKMSEGFVAMWQAGTMILGPGALPGPNPHVHTLLVLVPAAMSVPPTAFLPGLGGLSGLYIGKIAEAVSIHLLANTTMDVQDGTILHAHLFLSFGADTAMRDLMLTKIRELTGVTVEIGGKTTTINVDPDVEGSRVSDWCLGVATGIINHLTAAAGMSLALGAGHVHVLN